MTGAGVINASVNGMYVVSDMVKPQIIREDIVEFGDNWWLIDSGVPHLVTILDSVEDFDIDMARKLRYTYDCNVNICCIKDNTLFVRTYERGVENETLACGTGMVACFIRNHIENKLKSTQIKVYPLSKDELYVSYEDGIYKFGGQVTKTFEAETFI